MKKAFTLAELMIVLTIIGILAAILLPSAFQVTPEESVLKFKKSNSMLGTLIRELVNSDRYYSDGDLGAKYDGNTVSDATYFCQTLADVLNTKKVNCADKKIGGAGYIDACSTGTASNNPPVEASCSASEKLNNDSGIKALFDTACDAAAAALKDKDPEIVTVDNVSWYQTDPTIHFGHQITATPSGLDESGNPLPAEDIRLFSSPADKPANFHDKEGFDRMYKVFCIDVDGVGVDTEPFGYGIRADGRIIPGARADEWIQKSIQRGDD